MPKKEKKCIHCGGIHTKHKFCSDPCRKQYHSERKTGTSDVSSRNVSSIIYGIRSGIQSDQGYGFVFSNKIDDWTRSCSRKFKDSMKEQYHRKKVENSKIETNTVNLN
jgi:predicted nucleic acid-binding Zn ribbon protein